MRNLRPMTTPTTRIRCAHLAAAAAAALGLAAPALAEEDTALSELIMYMVNNDVPNKLLRFSWESNQVVVIGEIVNQYGNVVEELECLTYIPEGDHKGFYAASNYDDKDRSRLVRVNPLDATAYEYPDDIGFGYVVGMVAVQNPVTSAWTLLATQAGRAADTGDNERNLLRISPQTGHATRIMSVSQIYEGLARTADGRLLAISKVRPDEDWEGALWEIQPDPFDVNGGVETQLGPNVAWGRLEALEFAFGEASERIVSEGVVPQSWMNGGALVSYSDTFDQWLIFNPATGAVVGYNPAFDGLLEATDAEGLVFFTGRSDPYGAVLADGHD